MRHCSFRIITAVLTMLAAACGGTTQTAAPSRPAAVFPTRAELQAIPEKKVTPESFDLGNVQVESWNYESSALADVPYDDASPYTAALTEAIRSAPLMRLSSPLRCAAEETARFQLKHGKLPSESWRRFTVARCGSASPFAVVSAWSTEVPEGLSDAQLAEVFRDREMPELAKVLNSLKRRMAAGLAVVREGKRLALGFVFAKDSVQLDAGSLRANKNRRVVVRGTLRGEPAETIIGLVNRGKYGVGECVSDRAVVPPNFAMSCEMAEGDKWAWVDILARPRDRVLATTVATFIASAVGEELPHDYAAPRGSGSPAPVRTQTEFRTVLAKRLNEVRAAGRLAPLRLSLEQSAASERLAGVLMDTHSTEPHGREWSSNSTADRAAIGLMAGWDIRGLIRDGSLLIGTTPSTRDATVWLDHAIEHPMGRTVLLDPGSQIVAIGPGIPDSAEALGAVVTTYALFDTNDHRSEAERIFNCITTSRVERGLPAPVRVTDIPRLAEEAALVRADKKAPTAAMREILDHVAGKVDRGYVQAFVFETLDVDRLEFPKELFAAGPMSVAVEVTHHRAPGGAWGQYVVFVVVHTGFTGATQTTARANRHGHGAF